MSQPRQQTEMDLTENRLGPASLCVLSYQVTYRSYQLLHEVEVRDESKGHTLYPSLFLSLLPPFCLFLVMLGFERRALYMLSMCALDT